MHLLRVCSKSNTMATRLLQQLLLLLLLAAEMMATAAPLSSTLLPTWPPCHMHRHIVTGQHQ